MGRRPKGCFCTFHKLLCGPLANSLFHRHRCAKHLPHSALESAYHTANEAIQQIIQLAGCLD